MLARFIAFIKGDCTRPRAQQARIAAPDATGSGVWVPSSRVVVVERPPIVVPTPPTGASRAAAPVPIHGADDMWFIDSLVNSGRSKPDYPYPYPMSYMMPKTHKTDASTNYAGNYDWASFIANSHKWGG
jgi:hypothetical protein